MPRDREKLRANSRRWVARHPEQAKASNDRYRNSPEGKAKMRDRQFRKLYGLSSEQRDALFEAQGRRCACCGRSTPTHADPAKAWHTDHDHKTKAVRGIVCSKCNKGIGLLGDNAEGAANALAYLQPPTEAVEEHW